MLGQNGPLRQSRGAAIVFAAASSVFFFLLFWFWERDLLWMLAVLLPPIWSPVVYQRFADDSDPGLTGRAIKFAFAGLLALMAVGILLLVVA